MKKDNRGFLLAESLIVSTFVLTIIVFLFTQFKNVVVNQKRSYTYNNVEDIYTLGALSDFLKANNVELTKKGYVYKDNNCTDNIPGQLKDRCQTLVNSMDVEYIIFTDSNLPTATEYLKNTMSASQDLIDFASRIADPKIDYKGRLFAKFKNGNFATIITDISLLPVLKATSEFKTLIDGSGIEKANVSKVIFENNKNIQSGAISWDVSEKNNESVMAWVTVDHSDSTKYILHIGGDGKVIANPNSSYLFHYYDNLKSINFNGNFDTSNVTDMSNMFNWCSSLTSINFGSSFDTSNVTDMQWMFHKSALTSLDLSNFNTSKVTDMSSMFLQCNNLTDLDLGDNFDTSSVTNMSSMFYGTAFTSLDLGDKFNTINVTNMASMFQGSKLTNIDLGDKFDTSNVENMSNMFSYTPLTNLDLGDKFDTSKVSNMSNMFQNCTSLTTIYADDKFVTTAITNNINSSNMFYDCTKLVGGNGTAVAVKKVYDKTYAKIDQPGQEGYFTLRG